MAQRAGSDRETSPGPLTEQELQRAYEDDLGKGLASVFLPGFTVPCGMGKERPRGKVLLADTDPHVIDSVGCFLEAWGLSVRCEATATCCIAALRQEVPDLLLLGGEGLKVLQEVRAIYPDLPVLMIGSATPDAGEEAIRCGAQGVLVRPFRAEDLKKDVFRAMGERGRRKASEERSVRVRQAS